MTRLLSCLVLVLVTLSPVSVSAAAPPVVLALEAPPSALVGDEVLLQASLSDGTPVPGADVDFQRLRAGSWEPVATATTDRRGAASTSAVVSEVTDDNTFRAVFAGGGGRSAAESEWRSVAVAETAAVVTIAAPDQGVIGREVTLRAVVRRADDQAALPGAPVRIERRRDGAWVGVGTLTTDDDGRATTTVGVREEPADNRFRAVFPGTESVAPGASDAVAVVPVRAETVLRLDGPARIVDETEVTLTFRWAARDGRPVPGEARVWSRAAEQDWRRGPRIRFGKDGVAELRVGPRVDTRWKAVGPKGSWWRRDVSEVHRLDNVPPGEPVAYPAEAPRPRVRLPRQPRAVGEGPNGTVTAIPDAVWNQMTGRSWHAGCPVGRSELRLVRINYWGYDGYRYRGELVVRDDIAGKTVNAFSALYRAQLPIRAMYRVDRFGWSDYLHGGDNYDSMAAGNTSGFNCRGVVGNPSVPSPHSYGRSIDINTWENPYHSRRGWVPNSWWVSHSHPRIAWRSGEHPVVRIMRANGFRWTYGVQDAHHFDG